MTDITRITTPEEFDACVEKSHARPVVVFKHSLTCGVSTRAHDEFRAFAEALDADAHLALIEIQTARPLSAHVARTTGVRHESPQALVIVDGRVVWHRDHFDVTREALADALATVTSRAIDDRAEPAAGRT